MSQFIRNLELGGWVRIDGDDVVHIHDPQDHSEVVTQYALKCSFCWLGIPHSRNLHERIVQKGGRRNNGK